jgi:osmotically-inducible protein OsmY
MNTIATPARILALTGFLLLADIAGKSVIAASSTGPLSPADEAVRQRVVLSLQDAPYFYDGHVNVSVEKGSVVLRGFVFSDWDLRDAVRIATRAAEGKRVVDDLSIVEGGRR